MFNITIKYQIESGMITEMQNKFTEVVCRKKITIWDMEIR